MQQSLKKILAAALCASLLAGCAGNAAPDKNTQADTLIYGSGDYTSINPALYEHGEINLLLFSGLTAHDGQNQIVPALAERWEYDEAARAYTFHLRAGVKWHDGKPFTSADVKYTLEAIKDQKNASEIASNYENIASVETPDDQTVRILLDAPNVAMLDYLTIGILPKHLLEGKDLITDSFNQHPVGTGPYRLTKWDMGQSIVLKANPDYFLGTPEISRVVFKIVPDEKARALQLKSGELDLAQITPQDAKSFENEGAFNTYAMKTADYRGILYNFAFPLFAAHRELPAALSYAVDRQAIVDAVLLGHGEPAYSPLQMGPYNNPEVERYAYDPQKAKDLLEQAGWKAGEDGVRVKDGERLAFTINCPEGDPVRADMATICAQQLSAIGAEVTAAIVSNIDWAGQAAYLIGWGSPFDPDDHTYKVFGTDKGANYSGYSNAKVDELLKKARETTDDTQRRQHYLEFQTELAKDPAFTYLAYTDAVYVGAKRVQGITPETVLGHHGVGIFWNVADWSLAENPQEAQ